jgi:hypothetical protein
MMRWVSLQNSMAKVVATATVGAVVLGALGGLGTGAASAASVHNPHKAAQVAKAPNGSGYSYLAGVGPWTVSMRRVGNVSVEQIRGAWLLGQVRFHTNDPYYSCLNGTALNAWRVPANPGVVIVHNGDQGRQCVYGTFVYQPFYTGTFGGTLVVLAWHANVSVEALGDSSLFGQLTNFQSNDPYYACLDGTTTTGGATINVWTAPKEFGTSDVAHNGGQGPQCVYGTFVFGTN